MILQESNSSKYQNNKCSNKPTPASRGQLVKKGGLRKKDKESPRLFSYWELVFPSCSYKFVIEQDETYEG